MRTCALDGCEKDAHPKQRWCSMHAERIRKHGDPGKVLVIQDPAKRFWSKVDKAGPGDCWLWTGPLDRGGYGIFRFAYRAVRAHRYAWELLVGPIPHGLVLDHVKARGCVHRHCVNPAHLEPVTTTENNRRIRGA